MLLFVDLDGVVYRGREPVPGVAAVLADRAARGDIVVYVTNNSMHYRADYVPRLAAMGAPVAADRVVSSARATALHLAHREPTLRRVLVVGEPGLRRELADVGIEVIDAGERADLLAKRTAEARVGGSVVDELEVAGRPDAVVVGLDQSLTYGKLAIACIAVRGGARFIATNRDPALPTEHSLRPGAGSIVISIETATGVVPLSIGKPAPALLEEAARMVGARPSDGVVIGDGLATDVAAARAVGARSVLMLTGVTSRAQLEALSPSERPDQVAADAAGLATALERLAAPATIPVRIEGLAAREAGMGGAADVPRRIEKPWGHELIWAHTDRYVGKVLVIETGRRLSLQYHEEKDEWIRVLSGRLRLTLEDDDGTLEERILGPGDGARVAPGRRHRYAAVERAELIEVSTPELDDVVRLADDFGREGTSAP